MLLKKSIGSGINTLSKLPGWRNGPDSSPLTGKSRLKLVNNMNLEDLQSAAGVYVLLGSEQKYLYKGSARDLRKRVNDHLHGRVARTRNRRPLKLVYMEYAVDYTEARKRENWLKSGQGRKWLREQLRLGGGMADASDLKSAYQLSRLSASDSRISQ